MIYFNQASSSFPKAPTVADAIYNFINTSATNINRGGVNISYEADKMVYKLRESLLNFFGAKNNKSVIFTSGVTHSLNMLLKGFLKENDHVIISSLEHNAIIRPLQQLREINVSYSQIPCNKFGQTDPDDIKKLVQPNTKAIITSAASNVCGTVLDMKSIGKLAHSYGLYYFVDSASLAGFSEINMEDMSIDALAITGHKSLLGPQGVGALILNNDIGLKLKPLILGGTGINSDSLDMPDILPEHLEAGTLNLPGLCGLFSSISWLKSRMNEIANHEIEITRYFLENVDDFPMKLIGHGLDKLSKDYRIPLLSFCLPNIDINILANYLESEAQISTRVGLHCAPMAHIALNTFPKGTIRFSFGYSQTKEEIDICIQTLKNFFELIS